MLGSRTVAGGRGRRWHAGRTGADGVATRVSGQPPLCSLMLTCSADLGHGADGRLTQRGTLPVMKSAAYVRCPVCADSPRI